MLKHNFLTSLYSAIRTICKLLQEEVSGKFPDSVNDAVGGFLFLRYLVPSVVAPEAFGLIDIGTRHDSSQCLFHLFSHLFAAYLLVVYYLSTYLFCIRQPPLHHKCEER